jgi:hypothetical protein
MARRNGNGKKNGNGNGNSNPPRRITARRKQPRAKRNQNIVTRNGTAALACMSDNYRPMLQGMSRQRGSDFFGKVTAKSIPATAADRILAVFPISPSAFPGTRLTQIADLWERFVFNSFSVRYVPAVPNTLACQFVLYIDTDPQDDASLITDVDQLVRQAVSQAGSQQWNFNKPKTIKLAIRADKQLYYTGLDKQNVRFSQQGKAYLIQITNAIDFNGGPIGTNLECGSLFIDWDVNFQIAQINPGVITRHNPPEQVVYNRTATADFASQSQSYTETIVGSPGQVVYSQIESINYIASSQVTTIKRDSGTICIFGNTGWSTSQKTLTLDSNGLLSSQLTQNNIQQPDCTLSYWSALTFTVNTTTTRALTQREGIDDSHAVVPDLVYSVQRGMTRCPTTDDLTAIFDDLSFDSDTTGRYHNTPAEVATFDGSVEVTHENGPISIVRTTTLEDHIRELCKQVDLLTAHVLPTEDLSVLTF